MKKKVNLLVLCLIMFSSSACDSTTQNAMSSDVAITSFHGEENQNASNVIIHNSTTAPSDIEIYNKLNLSFYKALHLSEKNDGSYSISEKSLEIGKNKVVIPQISGMRNLHKQKKINSLIVENINKKILKDLSEPDKGAFFEFKYSTKFNNTKLISFLFEIDYYVKSAAHPAIFSVGINIDLDNSTILEKKDIIAIDEDVAKLFNDGDFVPQNEISKSLYPIYLDNIYKEDTLSRLETSEICFSDKGIEFIIETNYAMGGYMLLELPYTLLE